MNKYTRYALALFSVAAVAVLTGGCFSRPVRRTAYYDLQMPEKAQAQSSFQLLLCGNDSPARSSMLFRGADNRIWQDDHNCWVQPPEQMILRYINLAYPLKNSDKPQELQNLRITLNAFEFDAKSSEAVLALSYEFKRSGKRKNGSVFIREKASGRDAAAFSAAMNTAVQKAVKEIAAAAE